MKISNFMTIERTDGWWRASAVIGDHLVSVLFDEMPDDDYASLRLLERAGVCVHCEMPRCECCYECDSTWADCRCM